MKSKLRTHVSDPKVLRDPVAPSPTPLPLTPSAGFAKGAEGKRRERVGGAAGQPYPGENSQKAAVMNIHLWRWLGLWHVILAEMRDPRRPRCEAGGKGGGRRNIKARGRSHYPTLCRLNGIQPGDCVLWRHTILWDFIRRFKRRLWLQSSEARYAWTGPTHLR